MGRSYRCVYDPVLDPNKIGSKPKYEPLSLAPSKDPRNPDKYVRLTHRGPAARAVYAALPLPPLKYDSKWIGPPPPTWVFINGFTPLTSINQIRNALSSFGDLAECELAVNPVNMTNLGAARVKFKDSKTKDSHSIARSLIVLKTLQIGQDLATVEWDKDKFNELVHKAEAQTFEEHKKAERKKREQEIKLLLDRALEYDADKYGHYDRVRLWGKGSHRIPPSVLARHFSRDNFLRLVETPTGPLMLFDRRGDARRFYDYHRHRFYKFGKGKSISSMYIAYRSVPEPSNTASDSAAPPSATPEPDSTHKIMVELGQAIKKDILRKIIVPTIMKALDPAKYPDLLAPKPTYASIVSSVSTAPKRLTPIGKLKFRKIVKRPRLIEDSDDDKDSDVEMKDADVSEYEEVADGDEGDFIDEGLIASEFPQAIVQDNFGVAPYLKEFAGLFSDEKEFQAAKNQIISMDSPSVELPSADWLAAYDERQQVHRQTLAPINDTPAFMLAADWKLDPSDSWRSSGYVTYPIQEKSKYLPHRQRFNKNAQDSKEGERPDSKKRESRMSARRIARDLQTFDTDFLSFNQLFKNLKKIRFARSRIHNWGLFASEPIEANEMIIEYVGQVIREPLADIRERNYMRNGIGSSYMFRIDEEFIVDSTKKGGIGRLINHCCSPTCKAKVIQVGGQKHIVMYALRNIAANEELTYDYKFEREYGDRRVPCLCGADNCKGFLN